MPIREFQAVRPVFAAFYAKPRRISPVIDVAVSIAVSSAGSARVVNYAVNSACDVACPDVRPCASLDRMSTLFG